MTEEEIESCWRDSRNYKWGVYYCKADPRPIVPKRIKWMGWTINAARPSAIPIVLILLGALATPVHVIASNGAGIGTLLLASAAAVALLCLACASISSPKRWSN